jgi:hypothetical protein
MAMNTDAMKVVIQIAKEVWNRMDGEREGERERERRGYRSER